MKLHFLSGSGLQALLICTHMRDWRKKFQPVAGALKYQYLFGCQRKANDSSQSGWFLELQHFSLANPQKDSSGCGEVLTVITWEQGIRENKFFMNTVKCQLLDNQRDDIPLFPFRSRGPFPNQRGNKVRCCYNFSLEPSLIHPCNILFVKN